MPRFCNNGADAKDVLITVVERTPPTDRDVIPAIVIDVNP